MKNILLTTIVFLFAIVTYSNAQVAVIANKSVTETEITKAKLIEVFTLSTNKWKNGDKIVVFDLKTEGKVRSDFYSYLGKSPDDLKKIWMRAQLTGEGTAPKSLGSEYEVLEKVASTNGAIGFVALDKVNSSVKILLTIK